jgi:hypothetical protein
VKTAWATLIAAVLLFSSGCVTRPDWIEATLVTADATGVWEGTVLAPVGVTPGGNPVVRAVLELEQEGPKVKGTLETSFPRLSGPLEERVGGDVFHFKVITHQGEALTGEMTVSGDEMVGVLTAPRWAAGGDTVTTRISLRRVDARPHAPCARARDSKLSHYRNLLFLRGRQKR